MHAGGPRFGAIELKEAGPVLYLVDRNPLTQRFLIPLQRAVLRSANSLGARRQFQIRLFAAQGESPVFPDSPGTPDAATLLKAKSWMDDAPRGSETDAGATIVAALTQPPGEIVLITSGLSSLDDAFVSRALAALKPAPDVRVHTVAVGGPAAQPELQKLSSATGGTFTAIDEKTLATWAR